MGAGKNIPVSHGKKLIGEVRRNAFDANTWDLFSHDF